VSTGVVILLVVVGAAVLFALAWWSSGRSKGRAMRTSGEHEAAKGLGTAQGMTHDPPGGHTGRGF
jgi:hypothetical protein